MVSIIIPISTRDIYQPCLKLPHEVRIKVSINFGISSIAHRLLESVSWAMNLMMLLLLAPECIITAA